MKKILIIVSTVLMLFALMSCESMGYVLAGISDGMAGAGYGSSSSSSSSYGSSSSSSSYSSSSNSYSSSSSSYSIKSGTYISSRGNGEMRLSSGDYVLYVDGALISRGTYYSSGSSIVFVASGGEGVGAAAIIDSETFSTGDTTWYLY